MEGWVVFHLTSVAGGGGRMAHVGCGLTVAQAHKQRAAGRGRARAPRQEAGGGQRVCGQHLRRERRAESLRDGGDVGGVADGRARVVMTRGRERQREERYAKVSEKLLAMLLRTCSNIVDTLLRNAAVRPRFGRIWPKLPRCWSN